MICRTAHLRFWPTVVVDSSVAIKWFTSEPHSAEAGRILSDYQNTNISLLAPDLIYAEMGNIVWKKHLYQGLDPADGQPILDAFRQLAWIITPSSSLLDEAYQLAVANQRTVYDSLYLALSLREQCNLVTSDEKLVNSLSKSFQNLIWIGNWP